MATMHEYQPNGLVEVKLTIFACYGLATLAAAIATFGAGGVSIGLIVPAYWACVFGVRSRPVWIRAALMVALAPIGMFVLAVATPLHGPGHREATWRMSCANNLKSIALAVHNYHDVYKSFPPVYVTDADGRRLHSWRVLILPYLEDQQKLYDAYNFAQPWDGPQNRELVLKMPHVFCCPSQCKYGSEPTGFTNYVAVVGENTAWPGERPIGFADITDGSSNTLLLLEVANRAIAWTEPADIEYADAINTLREGELAPHPFAGYYYEARVGYQIALADGSVRFVAQLVDEAVSELLITRNDGEHFSVDTLQNNVPSSRRLRVGNCIRLGVFVLLAVLPFPWVWINSD